MEDYRNDLGDYLIFECPTGSAVICDPPVLDTDRDVAVLVKDLAVAGARLHDCDWDVTLDDPTYRIDLNGELPFLTARKGSPVSTNLIIFGDEKGYRAFEAATAVCKQLNLLNKEDRVLVFQAVCSGRNPNFQYRTEDFDE